MREEEIYEAALKKWGLSLQLGMLMEESAEVIQAAHKYVRSESEAHKILLAEEIADVEIMIAQIKTALRIHERVFENRGYKLRRLKERLED